MTYRFGRVSKIYIQENGSMNPEGGISLKATEHLTGPRSYAGTPAAVPAQIYTDEDCDDTPTHGPRNFEGRTYAGVYRDEDCEDTPTHGPRNFEGRSYARTRKKGRKGRKGRLKKHMKVSRRGGTKARYTCDQPGMKKDPDYPASGTPCILDTAGVR